MVEFGRSLSEDAGGGEHGGGAFAKDSTGGGLFLVLCLAIGLLTRNVLAPNMPFPYTVILLIIGLGLGALSNVADGSQFQDAVNTWANIDPHTILVVFLPTLIFESAFSVDFHIFRRSFWQLFILAVPGMAIGTGLTAAVGVYLFPYQWSWEASLMFGSILAATDPVAVVALLKELGASKQLETLIEGESLLNDGTAIVAFTAFRGMVLGEEKTIEELVGFGLQLSLGGPLLGAIFAAISIVALSYLYNDAVSEITVTVVGCYSVFMIAEATMLHTSGVLAVVTLGVLMSGFGKVHVSPEVEHAMHGFWEMLSYFSNTVIFLLSGVIIAHKTLYSEHIDLQDWGYLLALYALLHAIRLVVVLVCWPALACCGYHVDWRRAAVLTYAGLRGAVGLSLGLIVEQTTLFDAALAKAHPDGRYDKAFRAHVLFFVAGIAFLTLLVNGSTTKALLGALGLQGEPKASKQLFRQSCQLLNNRVEQRAAELQRDPHLLRADWRQLWAYLPVPTADVYRQRRSKGHIFTTRGEQNRLPPRLRNRWMRYAERFDEAFGVDPEPGEGAPPLLLGDASAAKRAAGPLGGSPVDNPAAAAAATANAGGGGHGDDGDSAAPAESSAEAADGSSTPGSTEGLPPPESPGASAGNSALLRTSASGRAARLQLLVECASNFAAGHEAAAGKARFWGVGGEEGAAAAVVVEAHAEAGRAEELLRSIEEAFPEVVRATQTGLAVRALLIAERREIESLARDGALEPSQAERLLDANSASTKKATLHPPSLDLPSVRQLIRGMAFASGVDGAVIDKLKAASRRRLIPAGSPIFGVAQPATAVVLLVSGQAALLAPNAAVVADRGFHVGFTADGDDGYDSAADSPRETAARRGDRGERADADDEAAAFDAVGATDGDSPVSSTSGRATPDSGPLEGSTPPVVVAAARRAAVSSPLGGRFPGSAGFGSAMPGSGGPVAAARGSAKSLSRAQSAAAAGRVLLRRSEGPGTLLGLLAVLEGTPHLADARARTPVEVVELAAPALRGAMAASPALTRNLWAAAAARVAELFLDTFAECSPEAIQEAVATGVLVVPAGPHAVRDLTMPGAEPANRPLSSRAARAGRAAGMSRAASSTGGSLGGGRMSRLASEMTEVKPPPSQTLKAGTSRGSLSSPGHGVSGWISTDGDTFILLRGSLLQRGQTRLVPAVHAFRTIHPCAEPLRFSSGSLLLRLSAECMRRLADTVRAEASLDGTDLPRGGRGSAGRAIGAGPHGGADGGGGRGAGGGGGGGAGSGGGSGLRLRRPPGAPRLVEGSASPIAGNGGGMGRAPSHGDVAAARAAEKFQFRSLVENSERLAAGLPGARNRS
ncbi:hypothetical protein FNF31_02377 [Cafeteria roenbergensis]|uniref:Cyclic nucleotide-binding domain-containing protein n=1 Tax=Cafeteria roenbergensis TaxID=33653 RepID=A0A5A8DG13_CAFRO|nr:hypothetical protein FNF31_02377 [Cafeteria roenbergensis]